MNPVAALESRLTAAVSAKLGTPCQFSRWIKKITGDVPVFKVPDTRKADAVALGLSVE